MLNTEFYFLFEMWSIAISSKRFTRFSLLTGRNAHHLVLGVYPTSMCSVCTVGLERTEQRSVVPEGFYSPSMCSVHTIGLRRIEQRSVVTALWFHRIWYYQESSGSPQKGSQLCVTVYAQEIVTGEGSLTYSDNVIPFYQPQLGSSHPGVDYGTLDNGNRLIQYPKGLYWKQ